MTGISEPRPWPKDAPSVKSQIVTLIEPQSGQWANNVTGKREMLESRKRRPFLAAWMGEWRTDIFLVPREVVARDFGLVTR